MNKKTDNIGDLFAFLKGDFISTQENKKHLPYILFIVLLILINIRISFHAESLIRKADLLKKEVTDLRLVYVTTKSDLMHLYKRTTVEILVENQGLKTSLTPPYLITKGDE